MPKPSNIDDQRQYRVKVARVIPVTPDGRVALSPVADNVVKGSFLRQMNDADVDSAELIDIPR
jgi:hypothetical protein